MGLEIERKFLMTLTEKLFGQVAHTQLVITQGYLNKDIDRTVRVRVTEGAEFSAAIAVKGRNVGAIRNEFEYAIPVDEGLEMMIMCQGIIMKNRYLYLHRGLCIEIDEFGGDNKGLYVAEIEFDQDDERQHLSEERLKEFLPSWIGREVTDEPKFYNSSLTSMPFNVWDEPL